jgi:hypothetical protein
MDYFKVFTIIFMIFITYLLLKIYDDKIKESFAETEQSIGGIDDQNAINTLAQLAKQLMAGGATVPGNLSVKGEIAATGSLTSAGVTTGGITSAGITASGDIISNGVIKFGGTGATGFQWGNEGGNGWSCLRGLNGGDNSFCMHNTHGNGTRLHPGGAVTVKGRDILAEIDALKATTIKNDETINLRLTKGFAPDGSVNYTAGGPGDTVWVDGWNGGLAARRDPNTWLAQFRIQKNNR